MRGIEVFYLSGDRFSVLDKLTWMGEAAREWARDSVLVVDDCAPGGERTWRDDDGEGPDALDADDKADMESALEGFYYWYCLPGCLPDSEAVGPFKSERLAAQHANRE